MRPEITILTHPRREDSACRLDEKTNERTLRKKIQNAKKFKTGSKLKDVKKTEKIR